MAILVIGAGAWGTALAITLSRDAQQGRVQLWARRPEQRAAIQADRENREKLGGIPFPAALGCPQGSLPEALRAWRQTGHPSRLLVLAGPVSSLEPLAAEVAAELGAAQPGEGLIWLAKGLAPSPAAMPDAMPRWPRDCVLAGLAGASWPMAALSGPSFAQELARGLPAALTLAGDLPEWARDRARQLQRPTMRVYFSPDLMGVQVGGAVKNILAIAAGLSDGLNLGHNARAALITRGLAEAARLGRVLGADAETFLGLAALGDLVLTTTGDLSRNRRVGLALAEGKDLHQILQDLGHVAEGVLAARQVGLLAASLGVEMPITEAVVALLAGEISAEEAVHGLMSRAPTDEGLEAGLPPGLVDDHGHGI